MSLDNLLRSVMTDTNYQLEPEENIRYEALLWNGSQASAPKTEAFCLTDTKYNNTSTRLQIRIPIRNGESEETYPAAWSVDAVPLRPLMNQTVVHWLQPPDILKNNTPSIVAVRINGSVPGAIEACSLYASWQPIKAELGRRGVNSQFSRKKTMELEPVTPLNMFRSTSNGQIRLCHQAIHFFNLPAMITLVLHFRC